MPFARPSLAELDARLAADIESRLPGADPRLRRSMLGILARTVAGAHHELYGYLDWLARALFPDTAEAAELGRWAVVWGITRHAATSAAGTLTVTGTSGIVVPSGTVWRSGAGVEYAASAAATLADGTATVSVTARIPGRAGNAATAVKVSLVTPIAGVVSEAAVATAIAGGAEAESDDSLRTRLLDRIRRPPSLGTSADYVRWARAAHPAVTRAWCQSLTSGLGTVSVLFMTDAATDDGIPASTVVDAVDAYIEARRPVTADVTVEAPTAVGLDVTLSSVDPDTAAVRAAVEAEIADLVRRESEPGGTILLSHLREAISAAAGERDHVLTSPTADVTHTATQIAVPGDITWP